MVKPIIWHLSSNTIKLIKKICNIMMFQATLQNHPRKITCLNLLGPKKCCVQCTLSDSECQANLSSRASCGQDTNGKLEVLSFHIVQKTGLIINLFFYLIDHLAIKLFYVAYMISGPENLKKILYIVIGGSAICNIPSWC